MIFPELPRRYQLANTVQEALDNSNDQPSNTVQLETPLRGSTHIDIEQWFVDHGLATDPAAGSFAARTNEPINWFARDAWELYILITVYTIWLAYWLGIHRGWW